MAYGIAPHLETLLGAAGASNSAAPPNQAEQTERSERSERSERWFILLDVGPFVPVQKPLERLLERWPGELLFETSVGAEAMDYSPRLIELGPDRAAAHAQVEAFDTVCAHLPVLSVLSATLTAPQLLQRLRFLMWVDADRSPYLLRIADTPSMQAVATVLTPAQRGTLFAGLRGWWCVDYQGRLNDLTAGERVGAPAAPGGTASAWETPFARFELDASQTQGVMRGTEVQMVAAQMRQAEPSFAQRLSHARQARFASEFLDEARREAYEEDEMLSQARARWAATQDPGEDDA